MPFKMFLFISFILIIWLYIRDKHHDAKLQQELEKELHQLQKQKEYEVLKKRNEEERMNKIMKFRSLLPITAENTSTNIFLQYWSEIDFNSTEQLDRQVRALYQTIPIKIDTKLHSGTFASTNNTGRLYETDFSTCTCPDFTTRQQPCKHMYRVFHLINFPDLTNKDIVDVPYCLSDVFENIEQEVFLEFLVYCQMFYPYKYTGFCNKAKNKLISLGIFEKTKLSDYHVLLNSLTKDQIILALAKKGVTEYRPSWTKTKLIDWICETQPLFLENHFKDYGCLTIAEPYKNWAIGIKKSFESYKQYPDSFSNWK